MKAQPGYGTGYYSISATETLQLDSQTREVGPGETYEARACVVGFEGEPGAALLGILFADQGGREVNREIALIKDFSSRAALHVVRAKVPTGAKWARAIFRVNCELPPGARPVFTKLWVQAPEFAPLPGVSGATEEAPAHSTGHGLPHRSSPLGWRLKGGFSREEIVERLGRVHNWYHRVEILPGIVTPGINDCHAVLTHLQLPEDCTGLRALDIGARDGFFSFVLEQRGAREVVALDHAPPDSTGFPVLKEILDSQVTFCQDNVYNLSAEKYGYFDIVLFLGVLYHLRNPLLALENIRELCRDKLFVESHVIDAEVRRIAEDNSTLLDIPMMQFYPNEELGGDPTNWWGPNSLCLRTMLEATNFTVLSQDTAGDRSIVRCVVNNNPSTEYFRQIEKGLLLLGD